MSEAGDDARRFALMALLALWVAAWGYSLVPLFAGVDSGEALLASARVTAFLGWQGIAGMIALALWGIGRGFPKRSGTRRISALPLGMALALLLVLLGSMIWGPR